MNSEITVKMSRAILDRAAQFAVSNGYSLERLMEGYIRFLAEKDVRRQSEQDSLNDFLEALHDEFEFSLELNAKRDYRRYLIEKYK